MKQLGPFYRDFFSFEGKKLNFLSFQKETGGSSTETGKQKESDCSNDVPSGLNR